jgi:hypothetical protein
VLLDHALRLRRLSDRWTDLELRIKEAEQINESVKVSAINELRYTGRRFLDAWLIAAKEDKDITTDERIEFDTHIRLAEQYFNNADHDLTDSLIAFFSERRLQYLAKYGLINATQMHPTLSSWIARIEEAQRIIRQSRADRRTRADGYTTLVREIIPELIARYREIVNSEITYIKKHRIERLITWVGRIFTGVIGVVEILILYVHWGTVSEMFGRVWRSLF